MALEGAIVTGLMVGVTLLIGLYVMVKTQFIDDKIHEIMTDFLISVQTDDDLQKEVYSIGALIGNGVKSGIGFTKSGGKFGFKDIMAQIASGFINKYIPVTGEAPQREDERFKL